MFIAVGGKGGTGGIFSRIVQFDRPFVLPCVLTGWRVFSSVCLRLPASSLCVTSVVKLLLLLLLREEIERTGKAKQKGRTEGV